MVTCRMQWQKLTLILRNPFRLSYGVSETRQTYWLRLDKDAGWGEATLPPYYGVDFASFEEYWQKMSQTGRRLPETPAEIEEWLGEEGPPAARAALDLALYDSIGLTHNLPLYKLLGLPYPSGLPTSFTIAIDTPDAMAQQAGEHPEFPIIKIKLGSDDDLTRLRAVRDARPDARLRVDANAGWSFEDALYNIRAMENLDLEMIEQPLGVHEIAAMGDLQKITSIPLVADESVRTLADIEKLAEAGIAGVNLKLMKAGGLTPTLRMLNYARELGLKIMLGCMVETSLGTTAMAHLCGLAEWIDLDAPLLIANDPFEGITYDKNLRIRVPERPGLGVILKTVEAVEEKNGDHEPH